MMPDLYRHPAPVSTRSRNNRRGRGFRLANSNCYGSDVYYSDQAACATDQNGNLKSSGSNHLDEAFLLENTKEIHRIEGCFPDGFPAETGRKLIKGCPTPQPPVQRALNATSKLQQRKRFFREAHSKKRREKQHQLHIGGIPNRIAFVGGEILMCQVP